MSHTDHDPSQSSSFKVTDRRAFTAEGKRRSPDASPDPAPSPASPRPDPQPRPQGLGSQAAPPAGPRTATGAAAQAEASSLDFAAFLQSLYLSALMALGEVENPYTGKFEANLDLARQNIDILAMLRDKTRGNLTPEEDGFLSDVVPQLQIRYVKKAG